MPPLVCYTEPPLACVKGRVPAWNPGVPAAGRYERTAKGGTPVEGGQHRLKKKKPVKIAG